MGWYFIGKQGFVWQSGFLKRCLPTVYELARPINLIDVYTNLNNFSTYYCAVAEVIDTDAQDFQSEKVI